MQGKSCLDHCGASENLSRISTRIYSKEIPRKHKALWPASMFGGYLSFQLASHQDYIQNLLELSSHPKKGHWRERESLRQGKQKPRSETGQDGLAINIDVKPPCESTTDHIQWREEKPALPCLEGKAF